MISKIESSFDSWDQIDALHLSEVKDELFNEISDEEFKSVLKELKLIDKNGDSSRKAFHNIMLATYWHYPYVEGKVKLDRFALPNRYFIIGPKGIGCIRTALKRKKLIA